MQQGRLLTHPAFARQRFRELTGLPDSMLEHAKQRTQQIIQAYEAIKSARQR